MSRRSNLVATPEGYMALTEFATKHSLRTSTLYRMCAQGRVQYIRKTSGLIFIRCDEQIKTLSVYQMKPEGHIGTKEFAELWNMSQSTVFKYIYKGWLTAVKHGSHWFLKPDSQVSVPNQNVGGLAS